MDVKKLFGRVFHIYQMNFISVYALYTFDLYIFFCFVQSKSPVWLLQNLPKELHTGNGQSGLQYF